MGSGEDGDMSMFHILDTGIMKTN